MPGWRMTCGSTRLTDPRNKKPVVTNAPAPRRGLAAPVPACDLDPPSPAQVSPAQVSKSSTGRLHAGEGFTDPGRAAPCGEARGAAKLEAVRRPECIRGRRGHSALRVLCTSGHPAYRGQQLFLTAWERWSRVRPSTGNAAGRTGQLGRLGYRWTGAGACGPLGKSGRPLCPMLGVLCGATHGAQGAQTPRAWTLSVFRRIQTNPGRSLQTPHFALEYSQA